MDLTNAYCPLGCCRALGIIDWDCFGQLRPKEIRALGLRTGEELMIEDSMENNRIDEEESTLVFNPTDDPWEQWRTTNHTASPN
jgi:hypothetical protein